MPFSHYVLWAVQVRLHVILHVIVFCFPGQPDEKIEKRERKAPNGTEKNLRATVTWWIWAVAVPVFSGVFFFGCHKTGLPCWFLSFYMWLALDQQPPRFGKWRKWKESENREKWLISSQRNNALPTVLQMWRIMQKSKICSCMRCPKKEASVPVCFAITIPRDRHWDY